MIRKNKHKTILASILTSLKIDCFRAYSTAIRESLHLKAKEHTETHNE